jgi:enterochelin esterase-like enzyme
MRGMSTRQATKWTAWFLALLTFITACSPSNQPVPTSTPFSPTLSPQFSNPPPTSTNASIPERPACLSKPGHVAGGKVESTKPPQEYLIYLPACYDELTNEHYPVLYLLHGQTYTDNQWIRLGAVQALDQLINSGEARPFIIVFPDDRYWNVAAGPGFGDRLVNALVPYIDKTYRTIPNRSHRAIGGLSRGSGWALELGLTHWGLFSIIGLHSLAVFQGDGSQIKKWIQKIPPASYPVIFMDSGDNDPELAMALTVESILTQNGIMHEWHLFSGAHTEEYWSAHVGEYIDWYASQWNNP